MVIGIACDDYKLKKFEKELTKKDFGYEIQKGVTKDTKLIQVQAEKNQLKELENLCKNVELHFKRSN